MNLLSLGISVASIKILIHLLPFQLKSLPFILKSRAVRLSNILKCWTWTPQDVCPEWCMLGNMMVHEENIKPDKGLRTDTTGWKCMKDIASTSGAKYISFILTAPQRINITRKGYFQMIFQVICHLCRHPFTLTAWKSIFILILLLPCCPVPSL